MHCRIAPQPPGELPFFPTPYPGESFYSILCRYHVRSGNASDAATIKQLFGYQSSLAPTLVNPFHLEMASAWLPHSSGITQESLLRLNTAYHLTKLTSYYELNDISDPSWIFRHNLQNNVLHQSRFLRYCPHCAEEQMRVYGEAYWQLLPQIDEVEYCPVHSTRLCNSGIPVSKIKSSFQPASTVLSNPALRHAQVEADPQVEFVYEREKDFFIRVARNVSWLLEYGYRFTCIQDLVKAYKRHKVAEGNGYWLTIKDLDRAFSKVSGSSLLFRYFEWRNQYSCHNYDEGHYLISTINPCSHVMIMTALCGDAKTFYESRPSDMGIRIVSNL